MFHVLLITVKEHYIVLIYVLFFLQRIGLMLSMSFCFVTYVNIYI